MTRVPGLVSANQQNCMRRELSHKKIQGGQALDWFLYANYIMVCHFCREGRFFGTKKEAVEQELDFANVPRILTID